MRERRRTGASGLRERLLLLALVGVYLATVLPHLCDDPIIGGDEGWIMSASAKLATSGVFGSDLFRGFYGAEGHYFFNLPLHHLVLAGVFKLIGVGVVQARLVSAVFGLATLLLTYALGRRVGGGGVGLGAAALIVLLRLNLTPLSGLTLTDLGATVRYDLIAVPYGLGAVLLLLRRPDAPSIAIVAVVGLLVGLAALTQFIGAFFALPAALFLLGARLPLSRRLLFCCVLGASVVLPFLPYGAYIAPHRSDFAGQARSVEQSIDFTSPRFYWTQLKREPDRYALGTGLHDVPRSASEALSRPSARLALLVVGPLAFVYSLWRGGRDPARRLLGLVIVALLLQLALFESTKRFVYWVVVMPFACVAIADLAGAAWRSRPPVPSTRWLLRAAIVAIAAVFLVEGAWAAAKDVRDASDAPSYEQLGQQLDAALPEGASAMGDNRLWPALRDRDYFSLVLLFYHTNPRISRERATDVFGAMQRVDPDYVLLSPLSRKLLTRLSPRDSADFDRFLAERAELVATLPYPAYGPVEVFRIKR